MRVIVGLVIFFLLACSREDTPQAVVSENKPGAEVQQAQTTPLDTNWALHGNDYKEQRFSSLDQINRDTVKQLGLAWSFDMYTERGVEATPLIVDGAMYVTGSWSMVYALEARTGALNWFYDPQVDRAFLAKGCCDAVNRGVAYTITGAPRIAGNRVVIGNGGDVLAILHRAGQSGRRF